MENLFDHTSGTVTAPAGCGKTFLIAKSLASRPHAAKPTLVLTHTHAGVAALRRRFDGFGIPKENFRISTLDGLTMRLVSHFPARGQIRASALELNDRRNDYPEIRAAGIRLLENPNIDDIVSANFHSVIVDEYQDCSLEQHRLCSALSRTLTTYILGDPMQAIFGWSGTPADWNADVLATFPLLATLDNPWRWDNADNTLLGEWLLACRRSLEHGHPIDLLQAPDCVTYVPLQNPNDFEAVTAAASTRLGADENAIIICNSRVPTRHHAIAARVPGASVVENADLSDLVAFADNFSFSDPTAGDDLVEFAASTMTGIGPAQLKRRVASHLAETARTPVTELENAALLFYRLPDAKNAATFLSEASRLCSGKIYRPDVLRGCLRALSKCATNEDFKPNARLEREKTRVLGRSIRKRAVGSTLLVKGLEAEVAVIIDTHTLSPKNLYVAMTRGSKRLIVCSPSSSLNA